LPAIWQQPVNTKAEYEKNEYSPWMGNLETNTFNNGFRNQRIKAIWLRNYFFLDSFAFGLRFVYLHFLHRVALGAFVA
jgi:hypothetical protein